MTEDVRRIRLRVPFSASVLMRGAKRARDVVCLAETAVDLPVVRPQDLTTAVVAITADGGGDAETRYAGHAGDLWLPLLADGRPVSVEQALVGLASGNPTLAAGLGNPFHEAGLRPYDAAQAAYAAPLEEMVIRRVETEDREAVLARAAHLADDFLLCTDGTIWRRSTGPFLLARPDGPVAVVASRHDLPAGPGTHFGARRLAEAIEFAAMEYGVRADGIDGAVQILDADHIPDHDPLVAARAAADSEVGSWIRLTMLLAPHEQVEVGQAALKAAAAIHGLPVAVFGQRHGGFRTPLGIPAPGPEVLVSAVDAVRGFFADISTSTGSEGRKGSNLMWREHYESRKGAACRRFDVHERERLPSVEVAPDLGFGLPEGPRS